MDRRVVSFIVTLAVVFGVALCFAQPKTAKEQPKAAAPKVEWHTDIRAAHKIAVTKNRPILVVVGGPACTYCRLLEKNTLGDPEVADLISKKFVAVHLDYERDREICDELEVSSLPTSLVITHEADLLDEMVGYLDKTKFRKRLVAALEAAVEIKAAAKEDGSVKR